MDQTTLIMLLNIKFCALLYAIVGLFLVNAETVSIEGVVDLSIVEILNNQTIKTNRLSNIRSLLNSIELELNPVYPYESEVESEKSSEKVYYTQKEKLINAEGSFSFKDVELNPNSNVSYYNIKAISTYLNFSPNRVLVTIPHDPTQNVTYQANAIGKDNFATPDILHPENLPYMKALVIKPLKDTPVREYVINNTEGILQSGFVGDILASKWKTAGIVTAFFMMVFPYILEYLDPEAAVEMKARKKASK